MNCVCVLALSVTFLFLYEISREPLNGFSPNSQERRVWSLGWIGMLRSKVKITTDKNRGFRRISRESLNRFATNSLGRRVWSLARTSFKVKVNVGGLRAVYVWKNIFALVSVSILSVPCDILAWLSISFSARAERFWAYHIISCSLQLQLG